MTINLNWWRFNSIEDRQVNFSPLTKRSVIGTCVGNGIFCCYHWFLSMWLIALGFLVKVWLVDWVGDCWLGEPANLTSKFVENEVRPSLQGTESLSSLLASRASGKVCLGNSELKSVGDGISVGQYSDDSQLMREISTFLKTLIHLSTQQ